MPGRSGEGQQDPASSSAGATGRGRRLALPQFPSGDAMQFLLETIEYESDYLRLPKVLRRDIVKSQHDYVQWPLDVPDVPYINCEALRRLPMSPVKQADMLQALEWVSDPHAYQKLYCGDTKGCAGPAPTRGWANDVKDLLQKDYIFPVTRNEVKSFVQGFSVPKPKKQTRRTILDGRPENAQMIDPPKCNLPGLNEILQAVRDYEFCQEYDATGFFHQFRLHDDIAKAWVLRIGGRRYAWRRMPMGWKFSVYIAQSVSTALADFDWGGGLILVYLDNVYVFGHSEEHVLTLSQVFEDRCRQVHATFVVSTPVTDRPTVLGVACDLSRKTVSIKDAMRERLELILQLFDQLWWLRDGDTHVVPTTTCIWKIMGNITWSARVLHHPLCAYPAWLSWVSRRARQLHDDPMLWHRPCAIWPSAKQELRQLVKDLLDTPPFEVSRASGNGLTHQLYTDASDLGWGVVHDTIWFSDIVHRRWSHRMRAHTIAERELFALVEGVTQTVQRQPMVQDITVFCDNTNAVAWVTKWRARSVFANLQLSRLRHVLGMRRLSVLWIPSAGNVADSPSRW